MSEPKLYTEREKVLAERAAFRVGVNAARQEWLPIDLLAERALLRYPLPKVVRPRVVSDVIPSRQWRVVEDRIETRVPLSHLPEMRDWHSTNSGDHAWVTVLPSRVALWADLIARPNEEVEVES